MNPRILVVEDEFVVRELIAFHLTQAGFEVREAGTLQEAWAGLGEADAVVLDWMLLDGSGVEWLKRRTWGLTSCHSCFGPKSSLLKKRVILS